MQRFSILWADDEIDLLKPHILFLTQKGYDITPVNSGTDALDKLDQNFDLIFLDENMPGISGLETLAQIKKIRPHVPVVMITKSEEEHIMEEAIGGQIADYLIKPLNPNQILISAKKILDNKRITSEKNTQGYQQDFRNIAMAYNERINHEEWAEIYKKLVSWELKMAKMEDNGMAEVLEMQKSEANTNFTKFIQENYEDWLNEVGHDKPMLSHQMMKKRVFPLLAEDKPTFFILVDNLRYDQWKTIEPIVLEYFNMESESTYYSILPTTTAYARNAIFSGLMPSDIAKTHPQLWVNEEDEEGKNLHEEEFLRKQLDNSRLKDVKMSYHKIIAAQQGKNLVDNFSNLLGNKLNAIVYNFVDMLSHARTDITMIRELAPDEAAYRSITKSWFEHSPFLDMLRKISEHKANLIITTDHGTIRVKKPFKIIGDKHVNTNLRYKQGRNLSYEDNPTEIVIARKPERFFLPKMNISSSYVFAASDHFFAYPNNFNHYVNYYKDTFQHGGVSLEECIIPFVHLTSK